ncbi:hypothetical protein [Thermosyntropha sp.]|uniref:hypothetical protein n=1 Tax=Thermosyntropha sp. TaxID=2740820 RepID=UPI0025D67D14|nr:hypothetical protein [Thermosyntropha sp.]MBO8158263.1 hypothetical protein [Thermosyntropha sp.]
MEKKQEIAEEIQKKALNGRITCSDARKIAEELEVSPKVVGELCDELKIKICACELGCF